MSSYVEFDDYAEDYDGALAQGLSISGEDKSFFARGRVAWLRTTLGEMDERPQSVMDFGCGTGSSTPYFFDLLGVQTVLGVDISEKSLHVSRQKYGSHHSTFMLFQQYQPSGQIDLVFSNGVFHHIPPDERPAVIEYIYQSLKPGGLFALWENNPWNPGTRYIMSRCPFDRDAITLTPPEGRRLARGGGFDVVRTDFQFIFPRVLRWFRFIEPRVARLPFGTQYQLLCRKPM